ncbi:hypothetical protein CBW24_07885 [Pacificitalea manganoxidans]|uniref:IrrE N-terminal-like domain-containing protein n=1 Tax=Pacificitalea manganoxidans TaxID=1411902 RepID=A0A291LZ05_9RHOB|nr:ImmA/IrrE family metallo-endopeptidase [Pacificitalea manganoxidans]ATI41929.1 hypothetical protein CBW24_07885 [Pacificitalea manganoxidans]MDR6309415.1 Zn-dependent peptidase ImmA (M78 family) [Pacificitalea manganoxidans]
MTSRELRSLKGDEKETLVAHLSSYPVKLGKIAKDLGVAIKVSSMKTGISGQITKEDDGYVIRVNRHEARERQRFTIAHELSHYLLHRHIIDSSEEGIRDNVLYRSGAPERIEYEANRLAADIVMPLDLVEKVLQEEFRGEVTERTIEALAARFGVSKAAMEVRLSTYASA